MNRRKNWTHTLGILQAFIRGYATGGFTRFGQTDKWGREGFLPRYSFFEEHGGRVGDGDGYHPGFVYDVLLNKGEHTYFVSIFISRDERWVCFRLVRLADRQEPPLEQAFANLGSIASDRDKIVDEGQLSLVPDDTLDVGKHVAQWLQFQIDRDSGVSSRNPV